MSDSNVPPAIEECSYCYFSSSGYSFTLVTDACGVHLGSIPTIRDLSVKGLSDYRRALCAVQVHMEVMMDVQATSKVTQ